MPRIRRDPRHVNCGVMPSRVRGKMSELHWKQMCKSLANKICSDIAEQMLAELFEHFHVSSICDSSPSALQLPVAE